MPECYCERDCFRMVEDNDDEFGMTQTVPGPPGPTPDFDIGTVTTGQPGSDADASITGTPEHPLLNLTIPRGYKGEKGDKGDAATAVSDVLDVETGKTYTISQRVENGFLIETITEVAT